MFVYVSAHLDLAKKPSLAFAFFEAGKRVGLLDVDIHGPSIPKMLNLGDRHVRSTENALLPIELFRNFKVMSIGFLLKSGDDAVIIRGPLKYHTIRQLLKDVESGDTGIPYTQAFPDSPTAQAFRKAIEPILHLSERWVAA